MRVQELLNKLGEYDPQLRVSFIAGADHQQFFDLDMAIPVDHDMKKKDDIERGVKEFPQELLLLIK